MRHIRSLAWTVSLSGALFVCAQPQVRAQGSDSPAQDGVEVLTRGPVHEAYAEAVDANPQAPPVAPKAPPDPIPELPPDQKPEGDKVEWISGYWSWDVDRKDYIWVSGFWRTAPPGRNWLPGHWQQMDQGWQWVPGFWNTAEKAEVAYLPAPPPVIEERIVPAPGEGYFYSPGCWVYRDGRYLWRPGTWVAYSSDYLWVPAHYIWTPAGYVFVEGYWDLALQRRGVLFAPVYVAPGALVRVNFCFSPRHVICTDFMVGALFVRPCARHYYFGDYFEARYGELGFVAFVDYRVGGRHYDPLYGHFAHYPPSPTWERDTRALYVGRFHGDVARPPHTFAEQERLHISVAISINEAQKRGMKMEHISHEQVMAARHVADERHAVAQQRVRTEAELHNRGPMKVGEAPRVTKIESTAHAQDTRTGGGNPAHSDATHTGSNQVHTDPAHTGTAPVHADALHTGGTQPNGATSPGVGYKPSGSTTPPGSKPPGSQPSPPKKDPSKDKKKDKDKDRERRS